MVAHEAPWSRRKSACLMLPGEKDVWLKIASVSMATNIERRPVTTMVAATLMGDQHRTAVAGRGVLVQLKDLLTCV